MKNSVLIPKVGDLIVEPSSDSGEWTVTRNLEESSTHRYFDDANQAASHARKIAAKGERILFYARPRRTERQKASAVEIA